LHQRHNDGVDQHFLQGWHADPFGLHEQRYFSAGRPTKLVRDGRVEAYDEPPAQQVPRENIAGPASGSRADEVGDTASIGSPPAPYRNGRIRRRRTGLVNAAVALVAAAAVIAFVAVEGGFSPKHQPKPHTGSVPPGVNLAAFVKRSAQHTLARKTADFAVTGTGQVDGISVDLRGNGQIDLAANTEAVSIRTSASGTSIAESEIMTGKALYLQVALNGQSMAQYFGGKHWLEIPLPVSATPGATQDSPAWSMELLEQQGARVVSLGAQSVGGLTCDEYAVTPSRQAMLAAAQQEWARLGLSISDRAAARKVLANSTAPTITVWVDPARQLVCQVYASMQFSPEPRGAAPATNSIQMLMTFTRYGVPVHISVPAQSDTLSF